MGEGVKNWDFYGDILFEWPLNAFRNGINHEMFVRMLTVHCDQNNSYEITINGFHARKINVSFIFLT